MVGAERDALGRLPEWDLGDLYPGRDSPELAADLEALKTSAHAFQARYRGRLAGLDGAALGAAVAEYEALQEVGGRISSYAELTRAGNLADPEIARFFQTVQEKINAAATELLFFTLELNRLDDDSLKEKAADPALGRYRPWLRDVRAMRPHQLSDDLEKLLLEKSVAGRNAWTRLFDETTAELRFPIGGKELTEAQAMHLLSSPDGAARK
ncbi:MAG TPA: oligoendopeptidase F, partial [Stellaceae bacterium]|nr:oligoendopeptidase F [Stellaceae bacterium]